MKLKIKAISIFFVFCFILTYVQLSGYRSNLMLYASVLIMFFSAVLYPIESLGLYFILSYAASLYSNSALLIISYVMGASMKTLYMGTSIRKSKIVFFAIAMLLCMAITYIASGGTLTVYILLMCNLLMLCIMELNGERIKDSTFLSFVEIELIVASLLCSYFSIMASTVGATRLRIFSGLTVRSLANCIGISIIISVFNFNVGSRKVRIGRTVAIILESMVLLMTGSRGVLYSIIIVMSIYFLLQRKLKFLFSGCLIVAFILLLASLVIPETYDLSRLSEFSDSGRSRIWGMIISGTSIKEWVLGAGLNSIPSKYNWYAHSVFLDCAVSLGLPAFFLLLIQIFNMLKISWNKHKSRQLSMLIFTILMFVTHGSIFSTYFWIFLSFASLPLDIEKG